MGGIFSEEEAPTSVPPTGAESAGPSVLDDVMAATMSNTAPRHGNLDFRAFLLESDGKVFDSYKKIGDLGEGAFGDVWLASERVRAKSEAEVAGRKVAVKRVRKPNSEVGLDEETADSEEAIVDFRTEVELMKSLDHPSICRLLNVFEDPKNLFLVMEHIQGGELFDRVMAMGSFSEHDAVQVVRQVASALSYCHAHGVVHRDVKPENILMVDVDEDDSEADKITVKLIDFGFGCRILRGAKVKAKVGTFLYTAPEALKGDPCDEKIDVWALGCVLYALLSGNAPFSGADARNDIMEGRFSFDAEEWQGISQESRDLIQGMLATNPQKRLSAAAVHNHPWVLHQGGDEGPQQITLSRAMASMKSFHDQSCLRHLCTGVLARQLDESKLHELHETFTSLDKDDNGILSLSELKRLWAEFGLEKTAEVAQLFADVDMDGSGEIDYTEFIAACLDQRTRQQEDMCWEVFRVFDLDSNGSVSYEELHKVVKSAAMNGAFSQNTLDTLWYELTSQELGEHPPEIEGQVDFDHFLVALGNAEAARAAPVGSVSKATSSAGGLPIARRHRGAATAGLPIAGRSARLGATASSACAASGEAAGNAAGSLGGLPIAGRRGSGAAPTTAPESAAGGGLPIASKQAAGGGLPIGSKRSEGNAGLPISSRH